MRNVCVAWRGAGRWGWISHWGVGVCIATHDVAKLVQIVINYRAHCLSLPQHRGFIFFFFCLVEVNVRICGIAHRRLIGLLFANTTEEILHFSGLRSFAVSVSDQSITPYTSLGNKILKPKKIKLLTLNDFYYSITSRVFRLVFWNHTLISHNTALFTLKLNPTSQSERGLHWWVFKLRSMFLLDSHLATLMVTLHIDSFHLAFVGIISLVWLLRRTYRSCCGRQKWSGAAEPPSVSPPSSGKQHTSCSLRGTGTSNRKHSEKNIVQILTPRSLIL